MISFECDYNNGACQQVLDNLVKYNNAKPTPYGFDEFSERAKERIREACGLPEAQIFFLTGGTQTNATTIDSMLYQYEGVICVGSGHINVHEAGAVEFTEHKIITLPDTMGKMEAKVLEKYLDDYMHDGNKDHAVHPGLVYITFPTEFGTLYTAKELDDIYQVCQRYEIPLYIRVLYRRYKDRSPLWRGCGLHPSERPQALLLHPEAAWSSDCERGADRTAVRSALYGQALLQALRTCHQDGHADESPLCPQRLRILRGLAYQPTVHRSRQ